MIGIAGTQLSAEERRRLRHPGVGGVILFTRNFESSGQLIELTSAIHEIRRPPLLVSVDQEGGRVQRFRGEFTELPPPALIGRRYDVSQTAGIAIAEQMGWLMAAELRAVGVDFSLAPVLDLDRGISQIVGDRGLHGEVGAVTALAQAWTRGMRRAGMIAIGKHFPGHGGVAPDSHLELPVDERAFADLEAEDLAVFRRLIDNGLEGVLAAHVVYSAVDAQPTGFSRRWLDGVLRQRLRFQGAILSDDLGMAGAAVVGTFAQRVETALTAGCDMALICNELDAVDEVLARLPDVSPAASMRLARLHGRGGEDWRRLRSGRPWQTAADAVAELKEGRSGELGV